MARHHGRGSSRPSSQARQPHPALLGTQRILMSPEERTRTVSPFAFLTLAVIFCLAFAAAAQVPVDDVHVNPRVQPPPPAEKAIMDPSLRTHTKPLKVDVNLVLVSVTITDPMNRLVTVLHKENFALYDGKDQQDIRHFSTEDAPVSLDVIFDMNSSMSS